MDRGAWQASVRGVVQLGHNLVTEHTPRQVSTGFSFKSLTALAPNKRVSLSLEALNSPL